MPESQGPFPFVALLECDTQTEVLTRRCSDPSFDDGHTLWNSLKVERRQAARRRHCGALISYSTVLNCTVLLTTTTCAYRGSRRRRSLSALLQSSWSGCHLITPSFNTKLYSTACTASLCQRRAAGVIHFDVISKRRPDGNNQVRRIDTCTLQQGNGGDSRRQDPMDAKQPLNQADMFMVAVLQFLVELRSVELNLGRGACVSSACERTST